MFLWNRCLASLPITVELQAHPWHHHPLLQLRSLISGQRVKYLGQLISWLWQVTLLLYYVYLIAINVFNIEINKINLVFINWTLRLDMPRFPLRFSEDLIVEPSPLFYIRSMCRLNAFLRSFGLRCSGKTLSPMEGKPSMQPLWFRSTA